MYEFIVNPIAGKGKSLTVLKTAERIFTERGVPYRVHIAERRGHATEICRELTEEGANIVVFGGDGTFNEVLNGIVNFDKTVIGFVPCGTGNDYVKATDIPTDTETAIKRILGGNTGYTDFIDMDGKRCLNVAGGGMDTDVLVKYAETKAFHGKIKYYISLLSVLMHLKFHKVRISIDGGKAVKKSVFLISIANGIYIGGGMPISPNSKVNDGKLNVVIVNEVKPSAVFGLLLKFLKGKHINESCAEEYLCDSARLEMLDEGKVQADGEVMEEKVLDCRIRKNILRVFVD